MQSLTDLGLALRLVRGAGRRELVRLLLMVLGVGLAVLAALIGITAPRVASVAHDVEVSRTPVSSADPTTSAGLRLDTATATIGDQAWTRVTVTGAGADSPLPPGLSAWPPAGRSVLSPELRRLAANDPQVADLVGPQATGTIGRAGLTAPDELFSYTAQGATGTSTANRGQPSPVVTGFGNPDSAPTGGSGLVLVLEVGLLVLTPTVVFLLTALRLSVASRSRRSFALGLVGMSPTRLARSYGWEMAMVALSGLVAGTLGYLLIQGPLGASGVLGVRWWPEQGRLSAPALIVTSVLTVAAVVVLARRSMWQAAARTRSERAETPSSWRPLAALALGVPAAGFLAFVMLNGALRPSSAWASDGYAMAVAGAVVAVVAAVILGVPGWIARLGPLLSSSASPAVELGLRGAAYRIGTGRRLVAFIACAVMLAGLSTAFITSLYRGAVGSPDQARIAFDLADARRDPHWFEKLPPGPFAIETALPGTTDAYAVVIGDCPAIERQAAAIFTQPGPCSDAIQRAHGGIGGATVPAVQVAGHPVAVPPGPTIDNVTWDLKFPPSMAPWAGSLKGGEVTYWVRRDDGSYADVLRALVQRFPSLDIDAGLKDPDQYAAYRQQVGTIRAAAALGVGLSVMAFLLAAIEARWERRRSLAALVALGVPVRTLRIANLVEFTFPVLVAAAPAALLGIVGGWAIVSFRGTAGMFAGNVVLWTLVGTGVSVLLATVAGWVTGGTVFRREALADS